MCPVLVESTNMLMPFDMAMLIGIRTEVDRKWTESKPEVNQKWTGREPAVDKSGFLKDFC